MLLIQTHYFIGVKPLYIFQKNKEIKAYDLKKNA